MVSSDLVRVVDAMIDRPGEDQPVLGDPPTPPDDVWFRAVDKALDPWAVPDGSLIPSEHDPWSPDDDAGGALVDHDHDGTASSPADDPGPELGYEGYADRDGDGVHSAGPDADHPGGQ